MFLFSPGIFLYLFFKIDKDPDVLFFNISKYRLCVKLIEIYFGET